MSTSDFFLGLAAALIVGGLLALVATAHSERTERDRTYADCLYHDGVLVQQYPTGYACINTSALHSWHEGP